MNFKGPDPTEFLSTAEDCSVSEWSIAHGRPFDAEITPVNEAVDEVESLALALAPSAARRVCAAEAVTAAIELTDPTVLANPALAEQMRERVRLAAEKAAEVTLHQQEQQKEELEEEVANLPAMQAVRAILDALSVRDAERGDLNKIKSLGDIRRTAVSAVVNLYEEEFGKPKVFNLS